MTYMEGTLSRHLKQKGPPVLLCDLRCYSHLIHQQAEETFQISLKCLHLLVPATMFPEILIRHLEGTDVIAFSPVQNQINTQLQGLKTK